MAKQAQAQNKPHRRTRLQLRRRLDEQGLLFTDLAVKVGHDLAVVSKAVNHGRYPRVLAKVKEALGV
jgi:hypothetical protein